MSVCHWPLGWALTTHDEDAAKQQVVALAQQALTLGSNILGW